MQKEALLSSEKIFKLNQGQDVAENIVGQNVVSPLLKPPEPIFSLSASKMEKYFPNFLASLALADGVKLRYKLPKKENDGSIRQATPIPSWDSDVDNILNRNEY